MLDRPARHRGAVALERRGDRLDPGRRPNPSAVPPGAGSAVAHRRGQNTDGRARTAAGRASLLRSIGPTPVDEAVYGRAVQECRAWPLQSIWIEVGPQDVRLQTGLGGVCPLYLAHTKGTLTGSWQLMDLREHLSSGALNELEVMRLLVGRTRYGHATLFTTIKRLSEHSTAHADAEGLRLTYPAAAEHALPSELAEHVGVAALVDAFESVVDHVLARRPLAPGRTAAQLSGGMDSTNLAISLALNQALTLITSEWLRRASYRFYRR